MSAKGGKVRIVAEGGIVGQPDAAGLLVPAASRLVSTLSPGGAAPQGSRHSCRPGRLRVRVTVFPIDDLVAVVF